MLYGSGTLIDHPVAPIQRDRSFSNVNRYFFNWPAVNLGGYFPTHQYFSTLPCVENSCPISAHTQFYTYRPKIQQNYYLVNQSDQFAYITRYNQNHSDFSVCGSITLKDKSINNYDLEPCFQRLSEECCSEEIPIEKIKGQKCICSYDHKVNSGLKIRATGILDRENLPKYFMNGHQPVETQEYTKEDKQNHNLGSEVCNGFQEGLAVESDIRGLAKINYKVQDIKKTLNLKEINSFLKDKSIPTKPISGKIHYTDGLNKKIQLGSGCQDVCQSTQNKSVKISPEKIHGAKIKIDSFESRNDIYPKSLGAHIIEKDNIRHFLFNIPKNEIINKTDYKIISEISKGSFGKVFVALWNGKWVAVKKSHGKMTLEAMRSVAREVNAYRKLRHPRVVKYYGVCLDPSSLCIITEYISGSNLFNALYYGEATIDHWTRIKLAKQLIQVVKYLHEKKNLLHRDLKTANLILDKEKNIKLCDFGKSRELDSKRMVKLEENGGSPRYMAPECFFSGNIINEKADVWSIGCCLIEIFGGPVPFQNKKTNKDIIHTLLVEKKVPSIPHWFHPSLQSILKKCLEWNIEARATASMIEMDIMELKSEDMKSYETSYRNKCPN